MLIACIAFKNGKNGVFLICADVSIMLGFENKHTNRHAKDLWKVKNNVTSSIHALENTFQE